APPPSHPPPRPAGARAPPPGPARPPGPGGGAPPSVLGDPAVRDGTLSTWRERSPGLRPGADRRSGGRPDGPVGQRARSFSAVDIIVFRPAVYGKCSGSEGSSLTPSPGASGAAMCPSRGRTL